MVPEVSSLVIAIVSQGGFVWLPWVTPLDRTTRAAPKKSPATSVARTRSDPMRAVMPT
jgi:hypothetical protein